MERQIINPWTWQDSLGFVQANKISGAQQILYTAGQVSVDQDGSLLHPNAMAEQIDKIIDNIETIANQAGFDLSDIVKMTYYTTDVQGFTQVSVQDQTLMKRLQKADCKPATSLIGVNSLFHPDCVVEIEATLVK